MSTITPFAQARSRKSQVPLDAALQQQLELAGLPDTIQIEPGLVTIRCTSVEDLLRQLVLLVNAADVNFEALDAKLETAPRRRSPGSETATSSYIIGSSEEFVGKWRLGQLGKCVI